MAKQAIPDFTIQNEGSIILIAANTRAAIAWVKENVSQEGYQPYFPSKVIVEPRYASDLVDGIRAAGLTVRG